MPKCDPIAGRLAIEQVHIRCLGAPGAVVSRWPSRVALVDDTSQ